MSAKSSALQTSAAATNDPQAIIVNMLVTSQTTKDLDGVSTEVLLQVFADRVLVLVTQLGKVGNLVWSLGLNSEMEYRPECDYNTQIQATIPAAEPILPSTNSDSSEPSLPPPPASIQLTPLLGNADSEHIQTLHSLYTSQIATLIWVAEAEGPLVNERRPVIVGIALRKSGDTLGSSNADEIGLNEHEKKVFYGVMELVRELAAPK